MNKNSKVFTQLIFIIILSTIIVGGLFFYSWQKRSIKNVSAPITSKDGDIKIVEVSLDVKAPFSEARVVVIKEGTITYSAKQEEEQEETKSNTITTEQLENLNNLILENNFFSLEEKPKNPDDPDDGSYYYVSVKYYPGDPLEPMFPSHETVYCYQYNCEPAFLEIKDKIIELWGGEVPEVGV